LKKAGSFFHSFSLVAIANLITKPLWLALFVFAARKLGVYQFGIYTYCFSIVIILSILIDFGLDYIAVRDVSVKNEKLNPFFNVVFLFRIFFTLLIIAGIIVYYWLFNANKVIITTLIIILLFQTTVILLQFFRSLISAFHNFSLYSKLLVFEKLIIVVFGFISLIYSSNLICFLFALLAGNLISFVYFLFTLKKHYQLKIGLPQLESLRYILKSSLPLVLMNVFIMAYFRVDVLILNYISGSKEIIGIYGSIHRIIEMYFLLPAVIMATAFPIISKKYNEDNPYIIKLVKNLLNFITVISFPIVIIIAFNSYNINYLIFGSEYRSGYSGLIFLIWTILPLGYNYILGHILIAANKQRYCAITLSVASGVNISLNYLLIPKYSFMGTCVALLITEIIIFIFYSYYVEKFLGELKISELTIKFISIVLVIFLSFYLLSFLSINLYAISALLLSLAALLLIKTKILDIESFREIIMAKSL
jgi:O-antigen/teichoic acid export membrane protein